MTKMKLARMAKRNAEKQNGGKVKTKRKKNKKGKKRKSKGGKQSKKK